MDAINNTSYVTDYSTQPPNVTYSNTVTTVIRQSPTITVFNGRQTCGCGCSICLCCCGGCCTTC